MKNISQWCSIAAVGLLAAACSSGEDGVDGEEGARGPAGDDGSNGDDGSDGDDGTDGDDGADGSSGDDGDDGDDGVSTLLSTKVLPLHDAQCKFGGLSIETGLDTNENGILDEAEVNSIEYLCQVEGFEFVGLEGAALPYQVLRDDIEDGAKPGNNFEIRNGGYGSAMCAHPTHPTRFYGLTDRGPNADSAETNYGAGKIFPTPEYQPHIGLFEVTPGGQVVLIEKVLLQRPDGTPITGLPNSAGLGGTGETPYYEDGSPVLVDDSIPYDVVTNPLRLDDYGLDGEGLAALNDGTFWTSDEYGPHMVHFDANGVEIGRINAFAADTRLIQIAGSPVSLPAEFARRRANRGMEGLTITPDQSTLVGVMQSAMNNPNGPANNSDLTRIVTVNLNTGAIAQYLYRQEIRQNSNSEIVALSSTEFLLVERDGKFYRQDDTAMKHVYRIDISTGTNLEGVAAGGNLTQDEVAGLLVDGQTLEQVVALATDLDAGWDALATEEIVPVSKELVVDLVATMGYPHDKLEGLWLISPTQLGVLNDNDFATWATDGVLEQKYLNNTQTEIDTGTLYVFNGLNLAPSN